LPITPDYEFLAKQGIKKSFVDGKEYNGYRLKTVKLRGTISQGLALPLSILAGKKYPTDKRENPKYDFKEGDDVTSLLSVVKYEPAIPASLSGKVKGMFPSYLVKTDEPRIQSVLQLLERYKNITFYCSEKVDGSSCTIFLKDGELNVCSRNLNLLETPENTFWKVAREIDIQAKLEKYNKPIALQGELVGSNINGNRLKIAKHKILFFSIYNYEAGRYLDYADFIETCKQLDIPTVPIIQEDYKLPKTVDELVAFATRKSSIAESRAEGIVLRSLIEMHDADIGRLSFKVINPEYLLAYSE
jgi:RNA ligase (TIGR02306 family)